MPLATSTYRQLHALEIQLHESRACIAVPLELVHGHDGYRVHRSRRLLPSALISTPRRVGSPSVPRRLALAALLVRCLRRCIRGSAATLRQRQAAEVAAETNDDAAALVARVLVCTAHAQ
jgi:hypothetical protein